MISLLRGFLKKKEARVWLTGGALRDILLNRKPYDVDVVTEGDPISLARDFADEIGGGFFMLSEEFMACRVVDMERRATARKEAPDKGRRPATYDFAACRGGSIEQDLTHRDFTVNAMALELPANGGLIDPLGGRRDLEAGRLAAVGDDIFKHDPLRLLRALRLEKSTGMSITPELASLIRTHAPLATRPAPERIFYEISRLLEAPGGARGVRRLDDLELLDVLFPEIEALKGVTQNEYHHLDVYEHSLANCEALERIIEDPASFFPGQAEMLVERSHRQFAGDVGWRFVMSFAAITHDIAKPYCRFIDEDGQVRFFEHDRTGAGITAGILKRLKASSEVVEAVSFLVRKHMRFEGLLQQAVPTPRVRLRYLRATEPFSPEAIMLSVSDRLTVRGPRVTEEDVERHLALAREMMAAAFTEEEAEPPPRLIGGDELMKEMSLSQGPLVGSLLGRIREEQDLGNISSREDALELASRLLQEESTGTPND